MLLMLYKQFLSFLSGTLPASGTVFCSFFCSVTLYMDEIAFELKILRRKKEGNSQKRSTYLLASRLFFCLGFDNPWHKKKRGFPLFWLLVCTRFGTYLWVRYISSHFFCKKNKTEKIFLLCLLHIVFGFRSVFHAL